MNPGPLTHLCFSRTLGLTLSGDGREEPTLAHVLWAQGCLARSTTSSEGGLGCSVSSAACHPPGLATLQRQLSTQERREAGGQVLTLPLPGHTMPAHLRASAGDNVRSLHLRLLVTMTPGSTSHPHLVPQTPCMCPRTQLKCSYCVGFESVGFTVCKVCSQPHWIPPHLREEGKRVILTL